MTVEPAEVDDRYGPSALATPANAVTIIRLLVSPALLVMILREPSSWAAVAMWFVLAVTDGIDGALARRFGTTRSGAFLDPLADKVLVLGALFALVAAGRFAWLPVALIALLMVAKHRVVIYTHGTEILSEEQRKVYYQRNSRLQLMKESQKS